MTFFARIKADGFHACGLFKTAQESTDVLWQMAADAIGDGDVTHFFFEHKPDWKMDHQDALDSGAMVVGAVVILKAH